MVFGFHICVALTKTILSRCRRHEAIGVNELSFLMVGANVLLPLGVVLGHVCMPHGDDKTAATGAEESHIDEWPSGYQNY